MKKKESQTPNPTVLDRPTLTRQVEWIGCMYRLTIPGLWVRRLPFELRVYAVRPFGLTTNVGLGLMVKRSFWMSLDSLGMKNSGVQWVQHLVRRLVERCSQLWIQIWHVGPTPYLPISVTASYSFSSIKPGPHSFPLPLLATARVRSPFPYVLVI